MRGIENTDVRANIYTSHDVTQSVTKNQKSSESQKSNKYGDIKPWSPLNSTGSLVPHSSEYGSVIGDVQLSEKASEYLSKLKSKFHNMEFITVSKDMKSQVQQNAASYGNANKMVVLIDDEKLERMAEDESFRKKYEGIIAMSQEKMNQAKMGLTSSGASIKNFGMSVDSKGKESFFATTNKAQDIQKKQLEKKAAAKKAQKAAEKRKAEKEKREEAIQKAREEKAEKTDSESKDIISSDDEYVIIKADSMDELISRVQTYSYNNRSAQVVSDYEKIVGSSFDFKG